MAEYIAKIGFWVRAHVDITVDAADDAAAIAAVLAAAPGVMESRGVPHHFDDERRADCPDAGGVGSARRGD